VPNTIALFQRGESGIVKEVRAGVASTMAKTISPFEKRSSMLATFPPFEKGGQGGFY
jgi:hypothetical protein